MRKWLTLLFLCFTSYSFAQLSEQYNELKAFSGRQAFFQADSTPYLYFYYKKELHYLYPLFKAFQQEKTLIASHGAANYYEQLAQAAAFTGDYSTAIALEKASHEPFSGDSLKKEITKQATAAKEVQYTDAVRYILSRSKNNKVVMINEAHDKPLHRAFTASLLEALYQEGFRYLAMETLNTGHNASLRKVNAFTGHYTCEPVAGELVRKALELGYILIPYEDTASNNHTVNQREYAQAANLAAVLKKDSSAKILVHAGYGHIEEGAADSRIPMAAYFKILSGIDPLTIDQTELTEGSNTAYGALFYDTWVQFHPTELPVVPMLNNQPYDPYEMNLYDIHVVHPLTKYKNGRPVWMAMNGWKKETPVPPAYQSLFMVQAYYSKECNEKTVVQAVPADQTYVSAPNGYYYLYLHKGKYRLVFRDKLYKVLGTKEITIE